MIKDMQSSPRLEGPRGDERKTPDDVMAKNVPATSIPAPKGKMRVSGPKR